MKFSTKHERVVDLPPTGRIGAYNIWVERSILIVLSNLLSLKDITLHHCKMIADICAQFKSNLWDMVRTQVYQSVNLTITSLEMYFNSGEDLY